MRDINWMFLCTVLFLFAVERHFKYKIAANGVEMERTYIRYLLNKYEPDRTEENSDD